MSNCKKSSLGRSSPLARALGVPSYRDESDGPFAKKARDFNYTQAAIGSRADINYLFALEVFRGAWGRYEYVGVGGRVSITFAEHVLALPLTPELTFCGHGETPTIPGRDDP